MKKELKKQIVEELSKEFTNEVSVFYADFKGQTVKDLEALRKAVREAEGKARIIKNTLAKIAFVILLTDKSVFDEISLAIFKIISSLLFAFILHKNVSIFKISAKVERLFAL